MKAIKYLLLLTALLATAGTNAQTTEADSVLLEEFGCGLARNRISTRYEAGGTAGSGDFAPMWHFNNRQGAGSHRNGWAYARVGAEGAHSLNGGITLDWGADVIGGYNLTSSVFIQQAYLDFTWKRLNISLGQKERWGELKNHRLTTGALTESGNARPIPQVRISLPEYWNIPGTNGWMGIRGHLAYGMFTDGNWQKDFFDSTSVYCKNALYHSKAGFLRIGNVKKFPLTAELGLHMATQFGGSCYNSNKKPGNDHKNPTRLKDFLLALIPLSGDEAYDGSDQANVAGNVLGSYLAAITWDNEKWNLRVNYEHAFNDHSQMFWEYGIWTEQLVGLELELKDFKWIKAVSLEYFNLKNQSGPIYHDTNSLIPDQISCADNNYNHGRYAGWFNYGMMIATPLCSAPIYNKDGYQICYNNRVEAFHMGIEGNPLYWLGYRILLTKSNNWGTYNEPFIEMKENTSGLVELTFKPNMKWSVTTSFAFDSGELYCNNYGGMITITRRNIFGF